MKRRVLFRYALGLLALGLAIMALPASLEGPVLVNIGPGHAVAVLDAIGLVPLVLGCALLYGGLWAQQRQLARWVSGQPAGGLGGVFASGLGLGLLLASSFSGFFWWCAIGAVLFASVLVAASVVAARV